MRRLIDEQKLLQDIANRLQPGRPDEEVMVKLSDFVLWIDQIIKEQPTAYEHSLKVVKTGGTNGEENGEEN